MARVGGTNVSRVIKEDANKVVDSRIINAEPSDDIACQQSEETAEDNISPVSDITGKEGVEQHQPVSVKKREFDVTLLDSWSNENSQYTNGYKKLMIDISDQLNEFEYAYDEEMMEFSNSEEGSDIVDVESQSDYYSYKDEHDNDLEIFPFVAETHQDEV